MGYHRQVFGGLVLLVLLGTGLWVIWPASPAVKMSTELSLQALLGAEDEAGFEQVKAGKQLQFPADHGPHPTFRNEWWYLTATLQQRGRPERRFGVQFTLFRFALAPGGDDLGWRSPQLYMAHVGVTHVEASEHRSAERTQRIGPGLAGVSREPFTLWLDNWQLQALAEQDSELFPAELQLPLPDQQLAMHLRVQSKKGLVLQGDAGFSLKNDEGGASYYYSYPRLQLGGELVWEGESIKVIGEGWFDHEWSSNQLTSDQVGWDWFALQLSDGYELMYYRFRNRDGGAGHYQLRLIDPAGHAQDLAAEVHQLEVLSQWQSPEGHRYPARWRLRIPARGLDLMITPWVADQEMRHRVRYWEGAVSVSGSHQGQGYVELTGYD